MEVSTHSAVFSLELWQQQLKANVYTSDSDVQHTIRYWFHKDFSQFHDKLTDFGLSVSLDLEPLVAENHQEGNLPKIENFDKFGRFIRDIIHHPSYYQAGDLIYGSGMLKYLLKPHGLLPCLSLFFLASETGEAGHNCPVACTAGIIRVLQKQPDFPFQKEYLEKLTAPSYLLNVTGAQFLTEIQGGSDVGQNTTLAILEGENWRIYGEKWFCSNANAELIFITARYDTTEMGTKGLGLFLIPAQWQDKPNLFTFRRLKNKLGTKTMATAEIDFEGAYAYPILPLDKGFHLVMENVLHLSRLFNAFCVVAMARRAYFIAYYYAKNREAFSKKIITYPLILENLSIIKAENTTLLAGIYATAVLQDHFDASHAEDKSQKLLLRLLVNVQKFLTAKYAVEHIHHALDVLGGNGVIETFSAMPRLLRDAIVCENWEGTHNVLFMQILKDMHKYAVHEVFLKYIAEKIKMLPEDFIYLTCFKKAYENLQKHIVNFFNLTDHLQTLEIKHIAHAMGILFSSIHLALEAIDQMKKNKNDSKMLCLQLFITLHFEKTHAKIDQSYLDLLNRLLS